MSLPKIVLDTDKTTPIYELPLKIRQGDKGDVLTVLLGKSFVTYPDLTNIDVTLIAERSDQTLIKAAASSKAGNTFSVDLPDAMYVKPGVFRRVYFKIGDDSTSDIKIEVLSGTGSSSANGNYIQDFEDLLNQAMSYVYALNSLAGTYDAVIDKKVVELTDKMTKFVAKAQDDKEAIEQAYDNSRIQAETDAKNQRDDFNSKFNTLMDNDKSKFKTITDNFNKVISDGKKQNKTNQADFDTAESKRENDFTSQSADFEKRYVAQGSDFEDRFKKFISTLQSDYDSFKKLLTNDVADLNKKLTDLGKDTTALQIQADKISGQLDTVDLTQMVTNKNDITKLRTDVDSNSANFDNYYDKTTTNKKLENYNTKDEVAKFKNDLQKYADQKIADLINGAPQDMDTLKELSDLMKSNKTAMETLNEAIGKKVNKKDLTTTLNGFEKTALMMTSAEYEAAKTAGTLEDRFYIITD
ncbi:hypothetical protein [Companilactobacillus furfuricola]|uniref:hypothetical protein n=1 Tax=Companilactobacillus furfuricola TaxID=1462575 RepID=UPI000F77BB64|nr:hypothetical protein [Companilactobacillus furfuricola]